MQIAIAGGSGFLGGALRRRLIHDGHQVRILTRAPRPGRTDQIAWQPDGTAGEWVHALEGIDALVNLAGAGVADKRWTESRKELLTSSRVQPTGSLVHAIAQLHRPPDVLLNASAVGYYGARGDARVTEDTPPGRDFLAQLAVAWEAAAAPAAARTRVALLRTGLVLHPSGGALASMLLPFRLGVGGRVGSGDQYWPWIHLDDWVSLTAWLLATPSAHGPFNLTAPEPVTNARFTRALGAALNRPTIIPVPAAALNLALGELAMVLLTGQRAVPARATELGFTFRYATVEQALTQLVKGGKGG